MATWWCGQEKPRRHVLEHLETRGDQAGVPALRPARGVPGDDDGRGAARARRADRGASHALRGAGTGGSVERAGPHPPRARAAPRRAARARRLGRHARTRCCRAGSPASPTGQQSLVVSMQAGGGSKDTWVIGGADDSDPTQLEPSPQAGFTQLDRAVEPHGRQPVLARPLRRAARSQRAAVPRAAAGAPGRAATGPPRVGGHRAALPPRPRPAAAGGAARHRGAPVVEPAAHRRRHGVRPQARGEHRRQPAACAPSELGSEGAAVARHLARAAAAVDDAAGGAADQPRSPLPRRARRARRRRDHARRLRRAAGREPDARLRLALPEPRPPHGAGAADDRTAARRRGHRAVPRRRVSRSAAAGGRQLHHLPLALPGVDPHALRARAAARRREQPALGGLSGRGAARRRAQPAAPAGRGRAAGRVHARQAAAAAAARRNMDDIKRRDANGQRLALEAHLQTVRNGVDRPLRRDHGALLEPLDAVAAEVRSETRRPER